MSGRLDGKIALITGGASGIGRACAERFAEEGADVALSDIHDEKGQETVAAVEALGQKAIYCHCDTTNENEIEAFAQAAVDAFGQIDVVVAAAGISHAGYDSGNIAADIEAFSEGYANPTASALVSLEVEQWAKVIDVNLTGVMLTDRAAARQMLANGDQANGGGGASIINIASIAARHPQVGSIPYTTSKAGVWMLTKSLAEDLGRHGIRVNAIGPGFIETPMTQLMQEFEEAQQPTMALTPMGRMGQPIEVANTALFLASDESSFYTGQMLHPDGGFFAG
jgi:NAD(P)-dependent dehydrogenase (short-subunit alcohol dehydrogenase family)